MRQKKAAAASDPAIHRAQLQYQPLYQLSTDAERQMTFSGSVGDATAVKMHIFQALGLNCPLVIKPVSRLMPTDGRRRLCGSGFADSTVCGPRDRPQARPSHGSLFRMKPASPGVAPSPACGCSVNVADGRTDGRTLPLSPLPLPTTDANRTSTTRHSPRGAKRNRRSDN